MKSCVGQLEGEDLLLCWNILNGYPFRLLSTLESYKSLSFYVIWNTQSLTINESQMSVLAGCWLGL